MYILRIMNNQICFVGELLLNALFQAEGLLASYTLSGPCGLIAVNSDMARLRSTPGWRDDKYIQHETSM